MRTIRSLFALAALLAVSLGAQAQTTPLTPTGCSANRVCSDVDGDGTTLYANAASAGVVEVILADGTYYLGTGAMGMSVANYPVYRQPGNDKVILVTAQWSTWWTAGSGSGRGGYQRHQHWALLGGSLLMLP